jgi:K+-transporting ATPase KdpF subunit
MLDFLMLALAAGLFVITVGYAYACDRLWRCAMPIDYSLAALVTAGLTIYLTYALLRPERF